MDSSFGPQLDGQSDFTLLFEQTIFTILPSSVLLVIGAVYLYQLSLRPVQVQTGLLLWLKLSFLFLFLATELAGAILWSVLRTFDSDASLAAVVLKCFAATGVAFVLFAEHRRSPRSSALIGLYLFIAILLDIVKARSYYRRPGLSSLGIVTIISAVSKMVLLVLEEMSKKSLLKSEKLQSELGPECAGGLFNRTLFIWLNRTLFAGFKAIIDVDDLPDLAPKFGSQALHRKFQENWQSEKKTSKYCLAITCAKLLIKPSIAIIFPRLCFAAFKFSQPLLLQSIVNAVGQEDHSDDVTNGLITATILLYLGLAVSNAYYNHVMYRSVTLTRGHVVSSILAKTTRLNQSEAKRSAAVTLMSTDMDGIQSGIVLFHEIWASIIELAIGIYLLATLVGKASFLVVIPSSINVAVSLRLSKRMSPARLLWIKSIQTRVAATSVVLGQLKGIKMTGLAPTVGDKLQGLRVDELQKSKKSRVYQIALFGLATFSNNITPIIVMAGGLFWTNIAGKLSAAEAFSTLSVVLLVSSPLEVLLVAFPQLLSIMTSFSRVQKFLLLEEQERKVVAKEVADTDPENDRQSGGIPLNSIERTGDVDTPSVTVELKDVSVAAGQSDEPFLKSINMSLAKSSLSIITGPVGCGKTLLLKTILGETSLITGIVSSNKGNSSYCDQTSWLRNVSLRKNIIGESLFDQRWYDTVVHGCLLTEDFKEIAGGDDSLAGSSGVNLSGGQRQRIALARAVYSQKPVMILDDVFSALDITTAATVLHRLFGDDGIVRKYGAIVIIATHAVGYLYIADNVITIDDGGTVTVASQVPSRASRVDHEATDTKNKGKERQSRTTRGGSSQQANPLASSIAKKDKAIERQRGDASLYYFYLKSNGLALFAIWLGMVALSAIWQKMPAIFVRIWLEKDPDNNIYFVGFAVLGATSFLCSMAMLTVYMMKLVPRSAENLHWMLVKTVMAVTIGFISSSDTGTILNRFSQDMTLVNQTLPRAVSLTLIQFFSVLVDLVVILSGAKYAAAILPALIGGLYMIQIYYLRTSRQMRYLDLEAKSPLYTQLTETAAGIEHIRAFGWEEKNLQQGLKLLDHSQKPYYYMFAIQRWLALVLDFCVMAVAVTLVAFALRFTGTTSQSAIGLSLLNMVKFSDSLSKWVQNWIDLETSLGAVARLKSFVSETPIEPGPREPRASLPASWPDGGAIELKNVTANYNPNDTNSVPVLRSLSATIKPGQKVGIIGRTGSGKSSFLLALLHLLEYSGSIVIDGVDIAHITRQELRSRITTLPQDAIELGGTVRDNLAPFLPPEESRDQRQNAINDGAMKTALTKVDLWEFISTKDGLDAEFSTVGLSQGQMQLFCLARAILHNISTGSKLVLIDEATSNVDQDTDRRMQDVIAREFAGCTILTIAHRLETLEDADVIFKMNNGLLQVKNGKMFVE
ncbi:hypothetical protein VHEMI05371 [[Torrubiella] hemipterigena]|uniref:ABC transporter n=1 Tax=[Torrubiella] hemipterigena TaxID=1531966 RepID=A0A0A1TGG8_9HYPO|nr:hypothetical protein VHEMI05371 [[Torrubiella] hemipterigena]